MNTDQEIFYQLLAQTSFFPLGIEIEKAKGNYIYDTHHKKYLDLISGIAVNPLGHGNPEIIKALMLQSNKYLHTMVYGEYIQKPQLDYAKKLTDHLPSQLNCIFFVNSGSEAVEGALKLAKRYSARHEIIYFSNAYHGSTHGSLSISGQEGLKNSFRPLLPGTRMLDFNNIYHLTQITHQTACVIIEPVQGEAGVIPADKEFINCLRKKCDETGTLLIFDEVQTGLGRTGKLWGFENYGVIPDILLLGKSLGGGLPLSAFISSKPIMDSLKSDPVLGHITTTGGNPLSCAAGLALFTQIVKNGLLGQIPAKEALFKKLLKHKNIREVRGIGLMLAIQLSGFEEVQKLIKKCLNKGIILDWFVFNDSSVRVYPPFTITEGEIEKACETILECL